eukprot:TRINITY_DN66866_c6_g1_i1.p1 TRINITY_DN66866_c6_g1~~TRINITY_DN66866_c6_g1_i1.p1  ORF type:complete len:157 (+),score=18.25 TRINITY_DN66866_c6_g1_i1:22-471(+)
MVAQAPQQLPKWMKVTVLNFIPKLDQPHCRTKHYIELLYDIQVRKTPALKMEKGTNVVRCDEEFVFDLDPKVLAQKHNLKVSVYEPHTLHSDDPIGTPGELDLEQLQVGLTSQIELSTGVGKIVVEAQLCDTAPHCAPTHKQHLFPHKH